ncbi:MAG: FAD binding domain-containing protein, partial [Arthrobacter sp.]
MQIPAPFDYVRATSVDNALELLSRHGAESRVIAGGHSLLPMMKLRLSRPEWLIDINDLYELDFILRDGGKLRIGALTRHTTLLESDEIAALFPIVRDAEAVIADPVVRNRGTIGGSLCQADPAEDLSTVCNVLGAEAVIRGPAGERILTMAEFHRG